MTVTLEQTTPAIDADRGPAEEIARARADYPGARKWTYTNAAQFGVLSEASRAAIVSVVDGQVSGDALKDDWWALAASARSRFAHLINAGESEIAYTKNVSEGLNIIANAMPWRDGDNVVLCPELEHPNNVYAWLNLKKRGVEARLVPARNGDIDVGAMIEAIDSRTRVATVATVTFTPGFRTDIVALGEACRERDVFFLVDAVQSTGVLETDVEASLIDGLATSSAKGLLGIGGLGFLYCRSPWIGRLEPAYLARFSVDTPDAHESEMSGVDYDLMADAQRFEIGNYNWAGIAAVDVSLERLLELGPRHIEAHVVGLASDLAQGFADLGLPVTSPPAERARTHIVTVGTLGAKGAEATDDRRLNDIARHLKAERVKFSIRRGLLRFGFHLYNNGEDVERILTLAREVLAKG
jgi:selenocysteine lyase/cysteine desulfurase